MRPCLSFGLQTVRSCCAHPHLFEGMLCVIKQSTLAPLWAALAQSITAIDVFAVVAFLLHDKLWNNPIPNSECEH